MTRRTRGIVLGMAGACAYGANPLFALPLYAMGIGPNSFLFYRYALAVLFYGLWVTFIKKQSLRVTKHEALYLLPMGLIFAVSSLTLFISYNYIGAGIASTILFIYPIMVAIIMALFFKEHISPKTILSIILTTTGIALFYNGDTGETLNLFGVGMVLLSALSYAVYMVALKKLPALKHIHYSKLTFYVMLFGLLIFLFNLKMGLDLQILHTPFAWLCVIASAILPTIISLETMTIAIKLIGPTLSAILGALEPVTAIFFGTMLFNEPLTPRIITGIILILSSVLLLVLKHPLPTKWFTNKHTV